MGDREELEAPPQVERAAGVANQPLATEALRKLRERFVSDPLTTDLSALRPVIARSWLRSHACNVSPGMQFLEAIGEPQLDEQVLRCAEPVLTDLERTCLDTGGCVSLADARGTIAVFRGERSVVRRASTLFPVSGGSMLEEFTGTNSDGTALEEGYAVQVWGAEHFSDVLQDSCCTTVPIRDPLRRSVRALLSLMLPARVASYSNARSISLIVHGAASEVTRSLAAHLAAREQALLTAYLREVRKRGTDAVVAMDDRTTIASRGAMQLLDQEDYAVLVGYAREAERLRRPVERDVTVGAGRMLHMVARPVEIADDTAGSVLRLRPALPAPDRGNTAQATHRHDMFPSLVGESLALRRALDVASTAVQRKLPTYIVGESGTGKLHLAEEMAAKLSPSTISLDCEGPELASVTDVETLKAHIVDGGAAVLRHVESLRPELREPLTEMVYALDHPPLILTARRLTDDALRLATALRGIEIHLAPLRLRRDDIALLATHFVGSTPHGPSRASTRLLQVLTEADWPGNVRQLKEMVHSAVAHAAGPEVNVDDLTVGHRKAVARPLTRLEAAELQEIRDALAEAGGSRVKAAAILQIGRSTLYRKINMYTRRGFELALGE